MKALFRIQETSGALVNEYEIEYRFESELRDLHTEARQVWSEYLVTVFTDNCVESSKLTWCQEVIESFRKASSTFVFAE